jgi:cell volume regulation protein A
MAIMDTDIPAEILIVMIRRAGKFITPRGATILKAGDTLMLAADNKAQLIELHESIKKHLK